MQRAHSSAPSRLTKRVRFARLASWQADADIAHSERARIIKDCLNRLTGCQMLILIMRHDMGWSWEQIGQELGVRMETACRMHERIRRVLLHELGRRGVRKLEDLL